MRPDLPYTTQSYIGFGPYCCANSLAMVLGTVAPEPSLIEVLTGSPFGMQIVPGDMPFFAPLGWDPGIGLNAAMELLGWTAVQLSGADEAEAVDRLRDAATHGPVLVGPLESGLLLHHPDRRFSETDPVTVGYGVLQALLIRWVDAVVGAYWAWEAIIAAVRGKPVTTMRVDR